MSALKRPVFIIFGLTLLLRAMLPLEATKFLDDMILNSAQLKALKTKRNALQRNIMPQKKYRWPNGRVFYSFKANLSKSQRQAVLAAMTSISANTCIRFQRARPSFRRRVIIRAINKPDCTSTIGYQAKLQYVNLGAPRCYKVGLIIHELLHSLGFYHQHMAVDRNKYVRINFKNIKKGYAHNFRLIDRSFDHGIPYDYYSIMHYHFYRFSKNNLPTIEAKCPNIDPKDVGRYAGLSEKDIMKINIFYECPGWQNYTRNNTSQQCP